MVRRSWCRRDMLLSNQMAEGALQIAHSSSEKATVYKIRNYSTSSRVDGSERSGRDGEMATDWERHSANNDWLERARFSYCGSNLNLKDLPFFERGEAPGAFLLHNLRTVHIERETLTSTLFSCHAYRLAASPPSSLCRSLAVVGAEGHISSSRCVGPVTRATRKRAVNSSFPIPSLPPEHPSILHPLCERRRRAAFVVNRRAGSSIFAPANTILTRLCTRRNFFFSPSTAFLTWLEPTLPTLEKL